MSETLVTLDRAITLPELRGVVLQLPGSEWMGSREEPVVDYGHGHVTQVRTVERYARLWPEVWFDSNRDKFFGRNPWWWVRRLEIYPTKHPETRDHDPDAPWNQGPRWLLRMNASYPDTDDRGQPLAEDYVGFATAKGKVKKWRDVRRMITEVQWALDDYHNLDVRLDPGCALIPELYERFKYNRSFETKYKSERAGGRVGSGHQAFEEPED